MDRSGKVVLVGTFNTSQARGGNSRTVFLIPLWNEIIRDFVTVKKSAVLWKLKKLAENYSILK